jgi:hypothetical protein
MFTIHFSSLQNVKMDQSGKDRNDVVVSPQQPIIVSSPKSPSTPDYRRGVVTGDDVDGIQHLPDGRTVFRARFDVRDFEPDEVSVRLEDIDEDSDGQAVSRLVVSARHVDEERPQDRFGVAGDAVRRPSYSISSPTSDISEQPRRRSREFNRRVSLPPNVDADRLISRLSYDGLLTVEAPLMPIADVALDRHRVQPPRYETLTSSSSLSAGRDANRRASEIPHSGSVYSRSRDDRKNSLPTSATTGATVASPRSYDVIEIGDLA